MYFMNCREHRYTDCTICLALAPDCVYYLQPLHFELTSGACVHAVLHVCTYSRMHVCMCTCVCSHVHVHASEHVHHVSLYACVGVCVCGIHVCECLMIIMFIFLGMHHQLSIVSVSQALLVSLRAVCLVKPFCLLVTAGGAARWWYKATLSCCCCREDRKHGDHHGVWRTGCNRCYTGCYFCASDE